MKTIFIGALIGTLTITTNLYAQVKIYSCKDGTISFFSATPLENIDAESKNAFAMLKTETNEISFMVAMRSFKFEKPLMQEHFNEKYVESEKYPNASFKGKVNEKINWSRDTVASISATGVFNCHGVDQPHTEKARLTIKNGNINIEGDFNVKLADHKIDVPTLVSEKIAETIKVSHKMTLTPYLPK